MLEEKIGKIYECIARPSLLGLAGNDPEKLHNVFLWLLYQAGKREKLAETIERILTFRDERLQQKIWGLNFSNPLATAAGFDKNGDCAKGIISLGVGFHEVGTVTPLPQSGFARPRIRYLIKEKALRNRMGFPNDGANAVAERLMKMKKLSIPVWINIGKGINTPLDETISDYTLCACKISPAADYFDSFVVNVSCPHMPGLQELRSEEYFYDLISSLKEEIADIASETGFSEKPLLVKISPDDSEEELGKLLDVCLELGVDGIIAVNTAFTERGGKSGKPIFKKAVGTVKYVSDYTEGKITIVGVGGIFGAKAAYEFFRAGAKLVQVYTGYVYQIWNPFFFYQLNNGIIELMERDGVSRISDIQKV